MSAPAAWETQPTHLKLELALKRAWLEVPAPVCSEFLRSRQKINSTERETG